MAKTKISEFSATANSNTDINSINIAEGCAPSNINDAIRELMAELKDFQAGTKGDSFNGPVGTTTAAAGAFTTLSSTGNTTLGDASGDTVTINGTTTFANVNPTLSAGTANGVLYLNGSKVATSGSALTFDGTNISTALGGSYYSANANYGFGTPDSAGLQIFAASGDSIRFGSRSAGTFSEQMRLTSTGLGIGTSSPGNKLSVNSGASTTIANFTSTGSAAYLALANSGATTFIGNDSTSGSFIIQTPSGGFSTKLTLDNSGNLGIGTSSPAYKLDVSGVIRSNTGIKSITASGGQPEFVLDQSGVASWTIYNPPSSTALRFYNGVDRMTLDSSGNLGLGVTPSAWASTFKALQIGAGLSLYDNGIGSGTFLGANYYYNGTNNIYKNTAAATAYSQSAGVHAWYNAPSGTAGNAISFTQAMTLDASGNLGIGTTSPTDKLTVAGYARIGTGTTTPSLLTLYPSASAKGWQISANNHVASALEFTCATANGGTTFSTPSMLLDSSGNLLVGTTSGSTNIFFRSGDTSNPAFIVRNGNTSGNTYGINVNFNGSAPNNTTSWFLQCNDTGAERATIRSNGGIANYQANDANLSDRREKTNFAPAGEYLSKICAIPVQTFNYIDQNMEEDAGLTLGVVAQDVQAVAPELVMESNWGTEENPKIRLSIYQTDLQYALMKSIQELKAELDSVKAELAQLKGA